MTAEELRPTCGCEQGMGHMDPGCHSYGLCHAQSAERAARPVGGPGANPRRLAWFTDDELVAELERRAPGNGGAEAAVRLDPICSDCEDHGDGSRTCDPERPACPAGMKRRAKALLAPARNEIASIRAALAPQAGDGAR